jgi:hypothetical protein
MKINMKKQLFILVCLFFCSCQEQPKIPVSNTLEVALGNRYSEYVTLLNKAFKKDTTVLSDFLKIDYIYDAAGYDHGFILFELMKIYGDKEFSYTLGKMSSNNLKNVSQYFEVGLDANDTHKIEMKKEYPISYEILRLKKRVTLKVTRYGASIFSVWRKRLACAGFDNET